MGTGNVGKAARHNGYAVELASLDGSSNTLLELAGLYRAGRPDLSLIGHAKAPYVPEDLAAELRHFIEPATDTYQHMVALFVALSTKLTTARQRLTDVDTDSAYRLDTLLLTSDVVDPSPPSPASATPAGGSTGRTPHSRLTR